MTQFLQTLTDGITVGALYALIALGYTMVYGILKFINFAHSDVFALGAHLSVSFAALLGTPITLMIALQYLIYGTKIGTAMRAVSFNTRTAALMGINVDRVVSFTFVIGSMLAAAAGFLYGLYYEGQIKQTADSMWV